jgi:predicted nucleic acid-binding protein
MKIYLDVCCLNRPFDDSTQDRIRLESEAILTILERCLQGNWSLVISEITEAEIDRIPNNDRKQKVRSLLLIHREYRMVDTSIEKRAKEIQKLTVKAYDALHIACAEKSKVDIFLTTDDSLLNKVSPPRNRHALKVRLENPLKWLTEVISQ